MSKKEAFRDCPESKGRHHLILVTNHDGEETGRGRSMSRIENGVGTACAFAFRHVPPKIRQPIKIR